MYIDVCEIDGEIHAWERDDNGDLTHIVAPNSDYLYLFVKDNTGISKYKDMYGNPMKRVDFGSRKKMKEYAEYKPDICEADISPVYRFIMDNYGDATPPSANVIFYDIEVDFDLEEGTGYPTPDNPFGEINAISIFNVKEKHYAMFIPDHLQDTVTLSDEEYPVEIYWCSSERDMLLMFADYLKDVDIMTAWNGDGFDLPYIMERSKLNFGVRAAETMYCRNGLSASSREYTNLYGQDAVQWSLKGRVHLDMMLLFKKFNPGEKKSFALASICEEELGETKIEFEDDLGSLYRENPQKFFEYSLHDSRLLKRLDDKNKVINLALVLGTMNSVKYPDVVGAVRPIEHGFMKFCRKKDNIVLPSKKDNQRESFPGAIVYDTIPGRHGMMMTVDLTGLYPSTMIMLGLSPETYIMQLLGEYEDYISVMTKSDKIVSVRIKETNEKIEIEAAELEAIIRESGYVLAASGAIFSGKLGLLAEFTQMGIDLRNKYKKLMSENFKSGDNVKGEMYNGYQGAVKVNNNSIYGASGEPSFRLYDIGLSKAITLSARVISKYQAYKANECVNMLRDGV